MLSCITTVQPLYAQKTLKQLVAEEKARKEAMENTFFRNLKIIWNDETESSKGKIIEIPFHIYVSSMEMKNSIYADLKLEKRNRSTENGSL